MTDVVLGLGRASVHLARGFPDDVLDLVGDLVEPRDPSAATVSISVEEVEAGWWMSDGTGWSKGTKRHDLIGDLLVARLNRLVCDLGEDELHLHAGALELDGRGILLGGRSGSGKSTVALGLLGAGARYLTDEAVIVTPGTRTVLAYPKPLTLKDAAIGHLPPGTDRLPGADGRAHARVSPFAPVAAQARIDAVVFPRYQPGAAASLEPVSPAHAAVRLYEDALDSIRAAQHGFAATCELVGWASCWELTYGDVRDAVDAVRSLPASPPDRPVQTFWMGRPGRTRSMVASFARSAALYQPSSRSMTALTLDEATAAVASIGDEPPSVVCQVLTGRNRRRRADLARLAPLDLDLRWDAADRRAIGLPGCPIARHAPAAGAPEASDRSTDEASALLRTLAARIGTAPFVLAGPAIDLVDGPLSPVPVGRVTLDVYLDPRSSERGDGDGADLGEAVRAHASVAGSVTAVVDLVDGHVPVRIDGRWWPVAHPVHRLVLACLRLADGPVDPAPLDGSDDHLLARVRSVGASLPWSAAHLDRARIVADRWEASTAFERGLELATAQLGPYASALTVG